MENKKKLVKKKGHKQKPKNKQELGSFSGVTKKKKVISDKKPKVDFIFIDESGKEYTGEDGRLKIDQTGGVSFLVKTEESWKSLKGHLKTIKFKNGK